MLYEAFLYRPTADRAHVTSDIMRSIAGFETAFSDFQRACEEECYREKQIEDMCELCFARMALIARRLAAPDSVTWEVWSAEDAEIVGVAIFSDVRPGEDAKGHYIFFDHDLRGKTGVLQEIIAWMQEDHANWQGLKRITVEIPDFAFALARHAHRKLGFGGPFEHRVGRTTIDVEGIKRGAISWRGERRDMLLLGLLREEREGEAPRNPEATSPEPAY